MRREFSSGGVVYRRTKNPKEGNRILWLVTKSKPSRLFPKHVWRLPKGWLDDEDGGKNPGPLASGKKKAGEEDLQRAALREVKEEGGIEARIVSKLGTEKYLFTIPDENKNSNKSRKVLKFVTFYLMEWKKDLPGGFGFETEAIEWLPYEEAYKRLSHSGERAVLRKAKERLDKR